MQSEYNKMRAAEAELKARSKRLERPSEYVRPPYEDIVKALREVPITMLPALVAVVIEEAVKRKLFLGDGLLRYVERIEHQTKEDHHDSDSPARAR